MTWTGGSASRTAAMMNRLHDLQESRAVVGLRRFTQAETWVHRSVTWLMGVCVFTGACLYFPPLAEIVGRRRQVVTVHEWSGIAIPVPVVLGVVSRAFRADVGHLGRFFPYDWRWLRVALRARRREPSLAGKFNAGQKLFASFTVGAVLIMAGTGVVMWFPLSFIQPLREAGWVLHDAAFILFAAAIVVHIYLGTAAVPGSFQSMTRGTVTKKYARLNHPRWYREATGQKSSGSAATASGSATPSGSVSVEASFEKPGDVDKP